MWIWVIFQDLYKIIKKTNSCPNDRHTINKCCKNKCKTRCQRMLCELTDTHPVYVNWQTHIQGMWTDRHTSSVCELTDTHLVCVNWQTHIQCMLTARHTSSAYELTDTHPVYADKRTSSVCKLTDTYPLHVYKVTFLTAVCTNCHWAILTAPFQDTDCHWYVLIPHPCYMFSSYDHQHAVPELCT